jgi:hypothetical protein
MAGRCLKPAATLSVPTCYATVQLPPPLPRRTPATREPPSTPPPRASGGQGGTAAAPGRPAKPCRACRRRRCCQRSEWLASHLLRPPACAAPSPKAPAPASVGERIDLCWNCVGGPPAERRGGQAGWPVGARAGAQRAPSARAFLCPSSSLHCAPPFAVGFPRPKTATHSLPLTGSCVRERSAASVRLGVRSVSALLASTRAGRAARRGAYAASSACSSASCSQGRGPGPPARSVRRGAGGATSHGQAQDMPPDPSHSSAQELTDLPRLGAMSMAGHPPKAPAPPACAARPRPTRESSQLPWSCPRLAATHPRCCRTRSPGQRPGPGCALCGAGSGGRDRGSAGDRSREVRCIDVWGGRKGRGWQAGQRAGGGTAAAPPASRALRQHATKASRPPTRPHYV